MASSSSSHKRSFSDFQRGTSAVSRKIYDAFINHRGPDVKETLAFALYKSLEEKECWTFLDDQELQLGDSIHSAIQNAIYSSRVQIAIFSPNYAESSWCLDELLLMLETKALFIPVFCDVKPSEVRYPDKGRYAAAFAIHQEKRRFSNDKINQWKEALYSSSLISGYEFSTSDDNVEKLCTKIALAVQQEVGKTSKGFPTHGGAGTHQKGFHADAEASTSRSAQVKKSSLLPRDSHPVGIQSKVDHMVGLLESPTVQVIAVVGMGGSGKTFLLQNVFKAVKSDYHHSIWLSISKSYSLKNLLHDIASDISITEKIVKAGVTDEKAAELIHARLQGKRSLVVLDDLWALDAENSLIDKLGLPDDCKVVVSTRNREVGLNLRAQIYEMQNLSDGDSWKLFCVYAFPNCLENRWPPHMEEEGRKIVKQCGNLPLAIKTIAASLANTTNLSKWKLKRRQLERVDTPIGGSGHVMQILKLSYDFLPAHLKQCFAYLSFFREDEEIDAEYLMNLWIGEGFIPAGEDQWDMASDCLDQLAQLCMLQVSEETSVSRSLIKFCKIHDLLHDLAIQISKENKCAFSVEEISTRASGAMGWCRILLAKKGLHENAISESRPVYLRTLSLSRNDIRSIPENFFATMRGLRILDLSYTKISTLPASVGNMVLLKVLNLLDTSIQEVPECVRHLKSLVCLVLPYDMRGPLPVWISELTSLQHFETFAMKRLPKGMSKLTSLRTLKLRPVSSVEEDELMRLDDLVNMTQLQELRFEVNHEIELKRMEEGILAQLLKMRHLTIWNRLQFAEKIREMKHLESIREMKHLESLDLMNFVVPSWLWELANLRALKLEDCECSDYPELQRMPNLVRLHLSGNKRCRELPKAFGKSGGFPQLRFLQILCFSSLEEFPELEEGAMACLEDFFLSLCLELKKVEGLERLKSLQRLRVFKLGGMNEWWKTLEKGGEYWNKIKAINPHLIIEL